MKTKSNQQKKNHNKKTKHRTKQIKIKTNQTKTQPIARFGLEDESLYFHILLSFLLTLTWTRQNVAFLVLKRRTKARKSPVLGLRIAADPFAIPYTSTAVTTALRPWRPG